jgi:multiple antibiotic resistance protein
MLDLHLSSFDLGSANQIVKFFGLAFTALLPLINPFGDALVMLGLIGNAPATVYRQLARGIAVSTTLFLLLIQLLGTALLNFFGISLPVMQIAGGLVLAVMGWQLLNQQPPPDEDGTVQVSAGQAPTYESLKRKIFYPFTFPITAGPGCIVVTVTLGAHASASKDVLQAVCAHAGIALAVLALSITVYFCYGYARIITARVSPDTASGILRVIAFVLLCIGVQIVWNGLETDLRALLMSVRASPP